MGHVDECRLQLLMELGDFGTHLHAELGVQVGQRFVHEEDLGFTHDGAAKGDALTLAAGQSRGFPIQQILDAKDAGGFVDAIGNFRLGDLAQLQAKRHVIKHGHMGIQRVTLEHHGYIAVLGRYVVAAFVSDIEITRGNLFQTGDHTQRCGFAAAGGAHQNDELFICDIKVEIADCLDAAVIDLIDALESNV